MAFTVSQKKEDQNLIFRVSQELNKQSSSFQDIFRFGNRPHTCRQE